MEELEGHVCSGPFLLSVSSPAGSVNGGDLKQASMGRRGTNVDVPYAKTIKYVYLCDSNRKLGVLYSLKERFRQMGLLYPAQLRNLG